MSEAELSGHLANGTGGKEIKAQERQNEREKAANNLQTKDNQLFEALNLLKAINLLQKKINSPRQARLFNDTSGNSNFVMIARHFLVGIYRDVSQPQGWQFH